LAPVGRFSPSGSWTSATGARGSLGTRVLTSTISCPVLVSTACCSIAHSSGASRLALEQRAIQPGGGALAGVADSTGGAAGAWEVCAVAAAPLDFAAVCASLGSSPAIRTAAMTINDLNTMLTWEPALDKLDRRAVQARCKVTRPPP